MIWIDFKNWREQNPYAGMKPDVNGQIADNFSALLFHLIQKADVTNRWKLRMVYPLHVELWEWWCNSPIVPTDEQIEAKAAELELVFADRENP